jgi:hypothetical protein
MTYRSVPADEVFAKLPKHVQEAGKARGQEVLAEYYRNHPELLDPSGVQTPRAEPLAGRSD